LNGNVSDWLAAGGTREQLWALTASAPEFVTSDSDDRERMQFTRLSDLLNEPDDNTRWLVENFRCRAQRLNQRCRDSFFGEGGKISSGG